MSRRLIAKLDDRLVKGDYYEAHQIYRTIYYRLAREQKHDEAYDLLYNGAVRLLELGQHNSGADLANLLVDMMTNLQSVSELKHTEEELVHHIRRLFQHILPDTPERIHFVSKALLISFLPAAAMRTQFAEVLWKEKSFAESRLHFIYSSDSGDKCALMLVEYQTTAGYSSEVDLMIAQFVLQVLCIENKQLASKAFFLYTLNHPQIKTSKPPFTTPLLNFICFLLLAIEKYSGRDNVFNILCSLYAKSLDRDPCYKEYLTQIGQIYFGQEKKAKSGGLFSNLFQSLFSDVKDDEKPNEVGSSSVLASHSFAPTAASVRNEDVDLD